MLYVWIRLRLTHRYWKGDSGQKWWENKMATISFSIVIIMFNLYLFIYILYFTQSWFWLNPFTADGLVGPEWQRPLNVNPTNAPTVSFPGVNTLEGKTLLQGWEKMQDYQSWNFPFSPRGAKLHLTYELEVQLASSWGAIFRRTWFNVLTWFWVQKPRSHFCSNFSRWIAVTYFSSRKFRCIGENSRTERVITILTK